MSRIDGVYCEDGEHVWRVVECDDCGGILWIECVNCSYWHDGGEQMSSQWCQCSTMPQPVSDTGTGNGIRNGKMKE